MKKLNLQYVIMFVVSLLLFVSCIGETPRKEVGNAFGVVREKTFMQNVFDISDGVTLYSSWFANMDPGTCLHIFYEIDYDLPANSPESVEANGYYQVSVFNYQIIDDYPMSFFVTDTTEVWNEEVAHVKAVLDGGWYYVNGMFFICNVLNIPVDQEMYWNLSCDIENYVTEENGKRYYDVFLRSAINESGAASTVDVDIVNAFDMKYYLEKIAREEKQLGHESFKLRFNYVSNIKDGQLTWSQQETNDIRVTHIIPED